MFEFKYPDSEQFQLLMHLQINKSEKQYLERSQDEYDALGDLIKKINPVKILDYGCGLGRSSVFFYNMLELSNTFFYLCDYEGVEFTKEKGCGIHEQNTVIPYNNLKYTEEFTSINNLKNKTIINLEEEGTQNLAEIDLIYSFHATGYHFGIETTFKDQNFNNITTSNAYMIFGIRNSNSTYKNLNTDLHINQKNIPLLKVPKFLGDFKLQNIIQGKLLQDFAIYKK
jgi:hypothetical protein